MHRGFITLHRKLVDWEWYSDANVLRLFIHLLLTANWEEKKWKGHIVKRGQKIVSIGGLAQELNLSPQQIRTAFRKLRSTGEITTKATNKFSLITLSNYDLYQDKNKNATNKTTNKRTHEQQTNNKQITTTKQLKTLETINTKDKIKYTDEFLLFWKKYPRLDGKAQAFKIYQKQLKHYEAEHINNQADKYAKKCEFEKIEKRFIKHASTFLNQCLDDEIIIEDAEQDDYTFGNDPAEMAWIESIERKIESEGG